MKNQLFLLVLAVATIGTIQGLSVDLEAIDHHFGSNRELQLTDCLTNIRDLEVLRFYSKVQQGDDTTPTKILFDIFWTHDITICSEPEIYTTYNLSKQLNTGSEDPIDSDIEKLSGFFSRDGNSVVTTQSVVTAAGQTRKSQTRFTMTLKNVDDLSLVDNFYNVEHIQGGLGNGEGYRLQMIIQVIFGLGSPKSLVKFGEFLFSIDTPTLIDGKVSKNAVVSPLEIKKQCNPGSTCEVQINHDVVVYYTDLNWQEYTGQTVLIALMPVYLKIHFKTKTDSTTRALRPIWIQQKVDNTITDIYNLFENIGLDDVSYKNEEGELRIKINALVLGKSDSLSFIVHCEVGKYDSNGQFIVLNARRMRRRSLVGRALQTYPANYEVNLIESGIQQAYEDKEACLAAEENQQVCTQVGEPLPPDTFIPKEEPNLVFLFIAAIVIFGLIWGVYIKAIKRQPITERNVKSQMQQI